MWSRWNEFDKIVHGYLRVNLKPTRQGVCRRHIIIYHLICTPPLVGFIGKNLTKSSMGVLRRVWTQLGGGWTRMKLISVVLILVNLHANVITWFYYESFLTCALPPPLFPMEWVSIVVVVVPCASVGPLPIGDMKTKQLKTCQTNIYSCWMVLLGPLPPEFVQLCAYAFAVHGRTPLA